MRKWIIASVVAIALFAVGAFAASFSFTAEDVASGEDAVASCTETASVGWHSEATSAATPVFQVNAADITTAAACVGRPFSLAIQFGGATPAAPAYCNGTLTASPLLNFSLASCGGPFDVADVTGAALLIGDSSFTLQLPAA